MWICNVAREFAQVEWDEALIDDCRQIVRLAVREDLDRFYDWTTVALIPREQIGTAAIVARGGGVIAGLRAAEVALQTMNIQAEWRIEIDDGKCVSPGQRVASLRGSVRDLLTAERLLLNLIGRLSGIATLTRRFVEAVVGTKARIYDTRKTTPGWRRLEKYAVRCGGGCNHRVGLFDAMLIKDNHLAFSGLSPAAAVEHARRFLAEMPAELPAAAGLLREMIVEVEVDTLEQFDDALAARPDIILLDNMRPEQMRQAVARRDAAGRATELEASGGVNLATVRAIAETGVDRISVGSLTHSAVCLDVGLDWEQ